MKPQSIYTEIVLRYESIQKSASKDKSNINIISYFKPRNWYKLKNDLYLMVSNGGTNHLISIEEGSDKPMIDYLRTFDIESLEAARRMSSLNLQSHKDWLTDLPILRAIGVITVLYGLLYWISNLYKDKLLGKAISSLGNLTKNYLISTPGIFSDLIQLFVSISILAILFIMVSFWVRSGCMQHARRIDFLLGVAIEERGIYDKQRVEKKYPEKIL